MPFYRTPTLGVIHMKGTKLPPPCAAIVLIDGKEALCMVWGEFLCDGPHKARSGTCDRSLCPAHATQVGRNAHLCPVCRTEALDEIGQRSLFSHLVQS